MASKRPTQAERLSLVEQHIAELKEAVEDLRQRLRSLESRCGYDYR